MSRKINLNADVGESFGAWRLGNDADLLAVVGAASIACGFHAGDPLVMRQTVRAALAAGVGLGAHPGLPDRQGFGRRRMEIPPAELEAMLIYQIGALAAIAGAEGGRLGHVKPHGALSNMACEDAATAACVVAAIRACDASLILLAPAGSCLAEAGAAAGLPVAAEIFADRAYADDGKLLPRGRPGAVLDNAADCLAHVRRMLDAGGIVTVGGKLLPTAFHSVCVHGDNATAVAAAIAIRDGLRASGFKLATLPETIAGQDR